MRFAATSVLGSALVSGANAHYLFGRLIVDGQWSKTWEYVREVTPIQTSPGLELISPITDPDSLDIRCGRGATTARNEIKTAIVQAGDTIGVAAGEPALAGYEERPDMYHPGFASAWLSKSPTDDLENYEGDGDWFKILSVTGRTEQSLDFTDPEWAPWTDYYKGVWGTFHLDSYNFTIPVTTPPGKYLLRFEHVFPNEDNAQFFLNCAQIEVVNDGEVGTPGPLAKLPGAYTRGQPDVYFSYFDFDFKIDEFVAPAPAVWEG